MSNALDFDSRSSRWNLDNRGGMELGIPREGGILATSESLALAPPMNPKPSRTLDRHGRLRRNPRLGHFLTVHLGRSVAMGVVGISLVLGSTACRVRTVEHYTPPVPTGPAVPVDPRMELSRLPAEPAGGGEIGRDAV
jgi:hypothetical protein